MKEESIKRGAEAAGAREGVMWYRMLAISGGRREPGTTANYRHRAFGISWSLSMHHRLNRSELTNSV